MVASYDFVVFICNVNSHILYHYLAPDPPDNVGANVLSANSILVTWDMPPDQVNGVQIIYTPGQGTCDGVQGDKMVIEGGTPTEYILSGLEEYTEYIILVSFRGTEGFGQPSTMVQARTDATGEQICGLVCFLILSSAILCIVPSGPPQMISVIPSSDPQRKIDISWSEPQCTELNDASVTGYRVQYGRASTPSSQRFFIETGANQREHTITNSLSVFVEYEIEVAARNSEGIGPFSEPMRVVIFGGESNTLILVLNQL